MSRRDRSNALEHGQCILGVEFGPTRIKMALIGEDHTPIASGSHEREIRLEDGVWTYHLDDVWAGLHASYWALTTQVAGEFGVRCRRLTHHQS